MNVQDEATSLNHGETRWRHNAAQSAGATGTEESVRRSKITGSSRSERAPKAIDTIQSQDFVIYRIAAAKPTPSHPLSTDDFSLQSSDVHSRRDTGSIGLYALRNTVFETGAATGRDGNVQLHQMYMSTHVSWLLSMQQH